MLLQNLSSHTFASPHATPPASSPPSACRVPQFCFIFNPHSGLNRRRPEFLAKLRARIAALGFDAEICATERPHHATELAHAAIARGIPRIVAVGGDGTLNEVACGVVGTHAALGLVPCGSGDGLGRHLGVHGSLDHALQIVRDGRIREIDTGIAAGHRFFNAMGLGFDAEIARRFNNLPNRGFAAYFRIGWSMYINYRPEKNRIHRASGPATDLAAFLITIANSDQFGNNARIAPAARVDDGQLDLVAVPVLGFFRSLQFTARLFIGDARRQPRVLTLADHTFIIERSAPGVIHVDGETREVGTEIEVRVEPRSLRFLVPARLPVHPCPKEYVSVFTNCGTKP